MANPSISLPGILYLEVALKYKVKSKNGKFPSHYKL